MKYWRRSTTLTFQTIFNSETKTVQSPSREGPVQFSFQIKSIVTSSNLEIS